MVPADDKDNARLIISKVILETLGALKMAYPETSAARRKELLKIRDNFSRKSNLHCSPVIVRCALALSIGMPNEQ